jgi:hypothetical protein
MIITESAKKLPLKPQWWILRGNMHSVKKRKVFYRILVYFRSKILNLRSFRRFELSLIMLFIDTMRLKPYLMPKSYWSEFPQYCQSKANSKPTHFLCYCRLLFGKKILKFNIFIFLNSMCTRSIRITGIWLFA